MDGVRLGLGGEARMNISTFNVYNLEILFFSNLHIINVENVLPLNYPYGGI